MTRVEPVGPPVRVRFLPAGIQVSVPRGAFLTLAAIRAGVTVVHDCDGQGLCATCRVRVEGSAAGLSRAEPIERAQLGDDLELGWRLCCRTRVFGDVEVRVPEGGFAYPPEFQRSGR